MGLAVFLFMVAVTFLYVVVGNFIYFEHVLPALNEPARLSPLGQWRQCSDYVALMETRGEKKWFFKLLRHARSINIALLVSNCMAALPGIFA